MIQGLSLVLRTATLPVIEADLAARVASAGDLFTNAPVLINVSALTIDGTAHELELTQLIDLLRQHTMRAVGIVGAAGLLLKQAQALGLTEEVDMQSRARRQDPETVQEQEPTPAPAAEATQQTPITASPVAADLFDDTPTDGSASTRNPPLDQTPPANPPAHGQTAATRVIDRPVRSGQQIYARGGDLVVLGMVSHGAEVIADGNIHVYGPLRGRAIAGANGDADARIFAASMEPELIAIAGTYRTTDKPLGSDVLGKPAQVRLRDDKLLVEPLKN